MTDKDILIRARDIPERQQVIYCTLKTAFCLAWRFNASFEFFSFLQISEEASGTPPTDEMRIDDECNWICNQLKTGMSATGERELVIEKEHIQEFINLIRFQKLDVNTNTT